MEESEMKEGDAASGTNVAEEDAVPVSDQDRLEITLDDGSLELENPMAEIYKNLLEIESSAGDDDDAIKENIFDLSLDDIQTLVQELPPTSNFVASKANAPFAEENFQSEISTLRIGALGNDELDLSQRSLLADLDGSLFSRMINASSIETFGTYIFNSYVKRFDENDVFNQRNNAPTSTLSNRSIIITDLPDNTPPAPPPRNPPSLDTNAGVTVAEGSATTITTAMLDTSDVDTSDPNIYYTLTGALSNGQLELTTNVGVAITSFTQDDLNNNRVVYVHDGSETTADNFNFTVSDGTTTLPAGTFSITVTAVDDAPTLDINLIGAVTEGGTAIFDSAQTEWVDEDTSAVDLVYTLTFNDGNGQYEYASNPGVAITSWTQDDVNNGVVIYRHDGSDGHVNSQSLYTITDGTSLFTNQIIAWAVAPVDDAPSLDTNAGVTVAEGSTTTITTAMLDSSDVDTTDPNIDYTLTGALSNGQLELTTNVGVAITSFTQDDLNNNRVVYVHDGSETMTDSFNFTVSDGTTTLPADDAFSITVTAVDDAPTLITGLTGGVAEGGTAILSNAQIEWVDEDTPTTSLVYTLTFNDGNGQYEFASNPGVAITSWTQDDVNNGVVIYRHDGSDGHVNTLSRYTITDGTSSFTNQPIAWAVAPVDDTPTLDTNAGITVIESSTTIITTAMLNTSDVDTTDPNIDYTVTSAPADGQLELTTNLGVAITTFTQDDLNNNRVVYVHGGPADAADTFDFTVSDGTTTLGTTTFNITVTEPAPMNLRGDDGNDYLVGGAGDDTIEGNDPARPDPLGTNSTIAGRADRVAMTDTYYATADLNTGTVNIYDKTTDALIQTITHGGPATDNFGGAISISGDSILIGAESVDAGFTNDGRAFIYDIPTGNLIRQIENPDPENLEQFGNSVALDGAYALIGTAGSNDGGFNDSGAAYVIEVSTGNVIRILYDPTPAAKEFYGESVAIDANYIVISAPADSTAVDAGSVHIYDRSTGNFLHSVSNPNGDNEDQFGNSISIDGDYLVVGARFTDLEGQSDAGQAYVYSLSSGELLYTLSSPSVQSNSRFGDYVSVQGDYALVASGNEVAIFEISTGTLVHTIKGTFGNGKGVAIDGNKIIVGSSSNANVYEIDFNDADVLVGGDGDDTIYGYYGDDILVGGQGVDLLYGGEGADRFIFEYSNPEDGGVIYDFNAADGDVIDVSKILVGYTRGVSDINDFVQFIDLGGNTYLVNFDVDGTMNGSSFSGAFSVVSSTAITASSLESSGQLDGTLDSLTGGLGNDIIYGYSGDDTIRGSDAATPDPITAGFAFTDPNGGGNNFGVHISIRGDVAVIAASNDDTGATDSGVVHVYDVANGNLQFTIDNPTPENIDRFGSSVYTDGNYIIVGAPQNEVATFQTGSAYIFDASTGALIHTLDNPTPVNGNRFGGSVVIEGNYAVVGDALSDQGAGNEGAFYVFDVTTGNLLYTRDNPDPDNNDRFGRNLDISDGILIVGSHLDDVTATREGSAFIYDVATGTLIHRIDNPEPNTDDQFGFGVAIDGDYAIIGASQNDVDVNNAGSAYIYDVKTGALLHTLENPTPASDESFANRVDISGNYAVVGGGGNTVSGLSGAGSAYIYEVVTGKLLHTINNPTPAVNENFGRNVAIDGNTLFISSSDLTETALFQIDFGDADTLYGGYGDDTIYGLFGDDVIYGQYGADNLYGGDGADRFVFEADSVFDAVDTIYDFNDGEGDIIDISDVLTGYTRGVSDINDFVRFVDSGADTTLEIDVDGAANGVNYQAAAIIINGAGLNVITLEGAGQLDATL